METRDQPSRVLRSKEETRRTYDRMSRWYDAIASTSEHSFVLAGLQSLAAQEGETILEIGFGTGHSLVSLAKRVGASGRVFGIDLSEGMLKVARPRVAGADVSARVELQCGDARQLPFGKRCFDAIFVSFTLELFDTPEISIVLQGCKRVLWTGGRIGVVGLSKCGGRRWMIDLYEWAHRRLPAWVDCRPILVEETLREAGFLVVEKDSYSMWGLPVEVVVALKPPGEG